MLWQEGFTGVTVFEKGPDLILWLVLFPRVKSVFIHTQWQVLPERQGEKEAGGKGGSHGLKCAGQEHSDVIQ